MLLQHSFARNTFSRYSLRNGKSVYLYLNLHSLLQTRCLSVAQRSRIYVHGIITLCVSYQSRHRCLMLCCVSRAQFVRSFKHKMLSSDSRCEISIRRARLCSYFQCKKRFRLEFFLCNTQQSVWLPKFKINFVRTVTEIVRPTELYLDRSAKMRVLVD